MVPPRNELSRLWLDNLRLNESQTDIPLTQLADVGDIRLREFQLEARREFVELAVAYSVQYGDFSAPMNADHVVMAGHQPELFHPGVWYKNFVLSRLGQQFDCAAINLVVDNDLSGMASVRVPHKNTAAVSSCSADQVNGDGKPQQRGVAASSIFVPFDESGLNVPHEERWVLNEDLFRSFVDRVSGAIGPIVDQPLVQRLWPEVLEAADSLRTDDGIPLGASLAAGRHRLESEIGLQTLELPISQLADTRSFTTFLVQVLSAAERFQTIYNSSLHEYRAVYRIRSSAHPVPELEQRDQWTEVPFWIWRADSPLRKRLFVRSQGRSLLIGDGEGWQYELTAISAVEELKELTTQGIKIRPRALMTTMYSRMILSDLFVHGIGGAQYDQLTDVIAQQFFGIELSKYAAVSATYRLPTGVAAVSPQMIGAARQRLRELDFHPERFVDEPHVPPAKEIIARKFDWINRDVSVTELPERHREIVSSNDRLQALVVDERETAVRQIEVLKERRRVFQVLGSRDFSFCLFPDSLVEQLSSNSEIKNGK